MVVAMLVATLTPVTAFVTPTPVLPFSTHGVYHAVGLSLLIEAIM
jgi:hypothetical protein